MMADGGTLSATESLRANLTQVFRLPEDCVQWLLDIWDCIQAFDDYADGDPVSRERLDSLIWSSLVGLPGNPWFAAHSGRLLPILSQAVLKWLASDRAERDGSADARSFVWRAGYYDLVLACVLLAHGPQNAARVAHLVMSLYGERFEDYMSEFGGKHA